MNKLEAEISIFEPMSDEDKARAIAEARAQVKAGQVIPLADVVRWLESWGKPDELPPPSWK